MLSIPYLYRLLQNFLNRICHSYNYIFYRCIVEAEVMAFTITSGIFSMFANQERRWIYIDIKTAENILKATTALIAVAMGVIKFINYVDKITPKV